MSSRDIEGENLLYLPQAKIYDQSCALGPGILICRDPLPPSTAIELRIERHGEIAFSGRTTLNEMKRQPEELVEYLFRNQTFPWGCFLLTGTGIVPPDSFTLFPDDIIRIVIDEIGVLENPTVQASAQEKEKRPAIRSCPRNNVRSAPGTETRGQKRHSGMPL